MSASPPDPSILDLKTGREIVEHAELRAGPFADSSIFDHAADAACLVIRKFLGVKGDGHFIAFLATPGGRDLIERLSDYGRYELDRLAPPAGSAK